MASLFVHPVYCEVVTSLLPGVIDLRSVTSQTPVGGADERGGQRTLVSVGSADAGDRPSSRTSRVVEKITSWLKMSSQRHQQSSAKLTSRLHATDTHPPTYITQSTRKVKQVSKLRSDFCNAPSRTRPFSVKSKE